MSEEKSVAPAVRIGDQVTGTVEHIAAYGAFVRLENGQKAMIHISELAHNYVKKVDDVLELQQKITAKVIKIDDKGRIDLSIKMMQVRENSAPSSSASNAAKSVSKKPAPVEDDFERKLASFIKNSDEKIADLNNKIKDSKGTKRKAQKK